MSSRLGEEPDESDEESGSGRVSDAVYGTLDSVRRNLPFPGDMDVRKGVAALTDLARAAVRQPAVLMRHSVGLATEQVKIVAGISDKTPDSRDWRFADDAFIDSPLYRRLAQSYLSVADSTEKLIDDLEMDDQERLKTRFVSTFLLDALAPTNTLLGNPAALRHAGRTGGRSLVDGARHAVHDLRHNDAMPSMVDTRPFVPGETVAATPGAVVFRNEVLELIQYAPAHDEVRSRPLLLVPPQINKFYIMDLSPGRSFVEAAVAEKHQVFMISWRNPQPEQAAWDFDTYVQAIIDATDAIMEITGSDDLNLMGICAGGMTAAAMAAYLSKRGDERIKSLTLLVTIIDWERPSNMRSFLSPALVATAAARSKATGILEGGDLGKIFAWLRPNDLVWFYFVNNYLMGKNPASYDVLSWNVDSTNLPSGLLQDFLEIATNNSLTKSGELELLGERIDLADISAPAYVVGAVTDHITPWKACFDSVRLLGGKTQFVLSSQGHIQALVNPIGNPKGRYFTSETATIDPDEWMADADEHAGSWWEHWHQWAGRKASKRKPAPADLGSEAHPAGTPAPGRYVLG